MCKAGRGARHGAGRGAGSGSGCGTTARLERENREDRYHLEVRAAVNDSDDTVTEEEEEGLDRATRNRTKKPWNNECMPKNAKGKVEISRCLYSLDKEVTWELVLQLLGARAL